MSLDDNKELIRRMTEEAFNQGDLEAIDRYCAPDFFNHVSGESGTEPYKNVVTFTRRFSNMNVIDDIIAEEDRVVLFLTVSGTLGDDVDLFGMKIPRGQSFTTKHVHTFRIRDGKAVEHWAVRDDLTMLRQLGAQLQPPE
jgi:predicted SnoaL-like aldol condensation-catalyzing enzyme